MKESRKKLTIEERLKPCACCGYSPVVQHHVLEFCKYPEFDRTISLCPNCHALYHIMHSTEGNRENNAILAQLLKDTDPKRREQLLFLYRVGRDAKKLTAEYQRVTREMKEDPDRLIKMHEGGKTDAQIFGAYHYLEGLEFEVLRVLP